VFSVYISAGKDLFYFQPWFWLLLNIAMFAMAPFMRDKALRICFICLLASALLYLLPQFFLASTDKDLRYSYWGCIAMPVAVLLFFLSRRQPGNPHAVE